MAFEHRLSEATVTLVKDRLEARKREIIRK